MKSIKTEYSNRIEYRNEKGLLHREDGHSVELSSDFSHSHELSSVDKYWFINGERHREDGPAVEYSDGNKSWYLNDIRYTEEEFHQELIKLKLKRLVNL